MWMDIFLVVAFVCYFTLYLCIYLFAQFSIWALKFKSQLYKTERIKSWNRSIMCLSIDIYGYMYIFYICHVTIQLFISQKVTKISFFVCMYSVSLCYYSLLFFLSFSLFYSYTCGSLSVGKLNKYNLEKKIFCHHTVIICAFSGNSIEKPFLDKLPDGN